MDDQLDPRLLAVAIELLRRAVVDLNGSIIANAQRSPDDPFKLRQPTQSGDLPGGRPGNGSSPDGLDVNAANAANKAAAAGWPVLSALLNALLNKGRGGGDDNGTGPRQIGNDGPDALGPRKAKALPAYDGRYPSPSPDPPQPRLQGYGEAAFVRIVGLLQSILNTARESRIGRAARAAAGGAARAAKGTAKGIGDAAKRVGGRIGDTYAAQRIKRDMSLLRGAFGKVRKSKVGRAAGWAAGKAGQGVKGAAVSALSQIGNIIIEPFRRVAQLLTPMSILSETINSAASGFQLISGAVKVLGATLAPILLPAFYLIAVAVTEVSDRIWRKLLPGLESWDKGFIGNLIGGISAIIKAFDDGATWFQRVINKVKGWFGLAPDNIGIGDAKDQAGDQSGALGLGVGGFLGAATKPQPSDGSKSGGDNGGTQTGGWSPRPRPGEKPNAYLTPETQRSSKDVLEELRRSFGPRASQGGIAARAREVQLAALNESPFEARILDRVGKSVDGLDKANAHLERIANNTSKQTDKRYPGDGTNRE